MKMYVRVFVSARGGVMSEKRKGGSECVGWVQARGNGPACCSALLLCVFFVCVCVRGTVSGTSGGAQMPRSHGLDDGTLRCEV